jgi:quinoprotein dehydrogenase-associated probable ABC transporter substrate-binding protein
MLRLITVLAFAWLACAQAGAAEPKSLALMDCELIDDMRPFASEQARREVDQRIVLIAAELAKELERRGGADFTAAVFRSVRGLAQDQPAGDERVLRVCQDPNNLPFSNRAGEGFENKIAELLARELGWTLEYTWFPQRMGFIRNTLRGRDPGSNRFKCDLVIGVPVGFELASTTKPYYRSTYALVYVKGKGLDGVTAPEGLLDLEPAKLKSLKLGVVGQTPPADWLLRHRLFDQVVPYQLQSGDPERYPGEIVEKDLVAGKVDVAFVWGPIAGYFAKNAASAKLAVVPFEPTPGIQFDFRIAMGVRFGEREWKDRIERLVEANRGRIQAILAAYGVPLLDDEGRIIKAQ